MSIAKKYFLKEQERRDLAKRKKYSELKRSYDTTLRLPDKNTGIFWDNLFNSVQEKNLINYMEIDRNRTARSWFKDLIKHGSEYRTLNIGCGDGNFEKLVSDITHIRHVGMDLAEKTINTLSANFPQFSFKVGNIVTKKGFHFSNEFDIVGFFEVLEHIPPQKSLVALKNIYNLLKPNGYLLISVPMNEGLEKTYPINPNGHLRCYSPELISAELHIAGFTVIKQKVFFAFSNQYFIKKFLSEHILKTKWMPNNILILAQKK